jgi:ABC-type transport system involved in cytochrome c biogenesis permease subunit
MFAPLVLIAWLYVALMMALAEATHSQGSVLGAIFTFVLFGVLPVALVVYIMGAPGRRKLRLKQADESAHTPADPLPPERKES